MASDPPKVFISYSHDSPEHAQHVLELAERLRKDGVDAQLDQYVAGTPPEGWPRWMLNRLDWANFVLAICTETYYRRFRGHEDRVKGKGADWEGNLITLEMYDAKSTTAKFAPVLFDGQNARFIPEPLRGHTQYLLALAGQGRVALSGLGGVGKTQTAVEYAHRHLEEYDHVFLTVAASRDSIVSGYVRIAGLLKLPEVGAQDQTLAVDAVKHWLGSNESWLLILDNADDLEIARAFIPLGKKGHVLLTTLALATGALARLAEIQEMGTEEGALFLLRRAKYIAEDAQLDLVSETDHGEAKAIAAQLDGLPLALDQAGAYIEETSCGLSGYLDLYRSHALELLRRRGALTSDHPDPVATTWSLLFEKIEKANHAAAELLRFCAFLHPDEIPEEVFSEGAPELGPVLGAVATDALEFNSAISEILKYSLLRREPRARTLEIHRLVQAVVRQGLDRTAQRLWAERAVRAINRTFPSVQFSTWSICDRLLPQAYSCLELINQWNFVLPSAARLLNLAGDYLYERGLYTDAEPLLKRALVIHEKALGPHHTDVAWSLNDLAVLYYRKRQYAKAEPLHQRALAIRQKALGPEHSDVAKSLHNLGKLYESQDQYAKAESLFQRALAILEKVQAQSTPKWQ